MGENKDAIIGKTATEALIYLAASMDTCSKSVLGTETLLRELNGSVRQVVIEQARVKEQLKHMKNRQDLIAKVAYAAMAVNTIMVVAGAVVLILGR